MSDDFVFSGTAEKRAAGSSIVRRDLPKEIVTRLRQEIVSGHWAPGERVTEQLLSERFGVSRTPLREALKVVAAEGLLELLPNRGAIIVEPTLEEAVEKVQVLGALESLAFQLACTAAADEELKELEQIHAKMMQAHEKGQAKRYFELNDTFHRAVVIAAHNRTLADLHGIAFRHVKQARLISEFRSIVHDSSSDEHQTIIDALMRRDGDAAKKAIEKHMTSIRQSIAVPSATEKPAAPAPAKARRAPARGGSA